jgi:hypothetical protein
LSKVRKEGSGKARQRESRGSWKRKKERKEADKASGFAASRSLSVRFAALGDHLDRRDEQLASAQGVDAGGEENAGLSVNTRKPEPVSRRSVSFWCGEIDRLECAPGQQAEVDDEIDRLIRVARRTKGNKTTQNRAKQSRADQSRSEQNRADQSRTEQIRAEQSRSEQNRAEQKQKQIGRRRPLMPIGVLIERGQNQAKPHNFGP